MILKYKQLLDKMNIEQDFTEIINENDKYISTYLLNKYMLVTKNFKSLQEFYSYKYCFFYNLCALHTLLKDDTFVKAYKDLLQQSVYNFVLTARDFDFIDYKEKEETYEALNSLLYIANNLKKQNSITTETMRYELLYQEIEDHKFSEQVKKQKKKLVLSYHEVLENDFFIFMLYYAYMPKEEFLKENILNEIDPYFKKLDKLKEQFDSALTNSSKTLENKDEKIVRTKSNI